MADPLCPCRSGVEFAKCCQPFLTGASLAPTAEALMRSRYSAFHEGVVDYLLETHQSSARAPDERAALHQTIAKTTWTNLLVLDTKKGREGDSGGMVEYVAAFRPKQPSLVLGSARDTDTGVGQLHERSRFVKDGGCWLYVDGDQLPPYRPGRSEPCWCGSGKKVKHCHK